MDGVSPLGKRSADVLKQLRGDIDRGLFAPGECLPTEKELCRKLKVGRTALRRAMAHLESDGLVDIRQGSGTYVRKAQPSSPGTGVMSLMYRFDEQVLADIQDYLLARYMLLCVYTQDRSQWNPGSERRFLNRIKEEGHRALLAFCSPIEPHNDKQLAGLVAAGTRVIHIEPYRTALPDQEYIMPDYAKAGHMAVMELLIAGYARVLVVGHSFEAPYTQLLEQGVAAALTEHGDGYDPGRDRFNIGFGFGENAPAQDELLAKIEQGGNVGLVCNSSHTVTLLAEFLTARGIRVPEDIGLVGPTLAGSKHAEKQPACLFFDRVALLKRAVDAALRPRTEKAAELVAPVWRPGWTIRSRKGRICA
jgi:DNA-binding LacI/PurR family transcriptional regulator